MIELLHKLVFKDFWLKLFSLALAILIWVTVAVAIEKEGSPVVPADASQIKQRHFFNLGVTVVSSSADVHEIRVQPNEVEVTVQADGKTLSELQDKDIRVLLDLTGVEAAVGARKRLDVAVPPGVTPVQVEPPDVEVIFPAKARPRPPAEERKQDS